MKNLEILFHRNQIEIKYYRFPLGYLAKAFIIEAQAIKEIRLNRWPPEIVLHSDEVIFLNASSKPDLELFAQINNIQQVDRIDVWSLLCMPYLDTEFTVEDSQYTQRELINAGFDDNEIEEIRKKIAKRMLFFNFYAWEWVHLSHYDVLSTFGLNNKLKNKLFYKKQKAFYDWCNKIAARAPVIIKKNI